MFIDSLMDDFEGEWRRRLPEAIDRFLEELGKASKNQAARNEYWRRYGAKARSSTAKRETVSERHQFFIERMMEYINERGSLRRKDPVRAFSTYERELLYFSSKKNCAICGKVVDWEDAEADHIEPHAIGSITTLQNARLVHKDKSCHRRGGLAVTSPLRPSEELPRGPLWEADHPSSYADDDEVDGDTEWMEGLTKKEAGNESRETFIALLAEKGIELEHIKGIEYRDQKNRQIIVPAANKPGKNGGFWLGASEKYFRGQKQVALVLLCRTGEKFVPFLLSPEATQSAIGRLTPKGDDQYKFNVTRTSSGRFELKLDDGNAMDLTDYLENYAQLA
jgi:hypothetical protein